MVPNITRGYSFNKLTNYLTSPKREEEGERVGFSHLENFVPGEANNPKEAAKVMAATWKGAEQLKAAAGVKKTGRKQDGPPVWHCSLSWHPTEQPSRDDMLQAARECLDAVGLGLDKGYQTSFIEHVDREHPHLHIQVNLVHPITGKKVDPYKDKERAQKWGDLYEKSRGKVFCEERAAKYKAINERKKPDRKRAPKQSREERAATKKVRIDTQKAKEEAAAIRQKFADRASEIKAANTQRFASQQLQREHDWQALQLARDAIRAKYKQKIDEIYRHKRNRDALPLTPKGFRDWKQTREWKGLSRRLYKQQRDFQARERTTAGRLTNAIALAMHSRSSDVYERGKWSMFFGLAADHNKRIELLKKYEQTAKMALSEKHFKQRRNRAEPMREAMNAELAALSKAYKDRTEQLKRTDTAQRTADRARWQSLAMERAESWAEWRKKHHVPERPYTPVPAANQQQPTPAVPGKEKTGPVSRLFDAFQRNARDALKERREQWQKKQQQFRENARDVSAQAPEPGRAAEGASHKPEAAPLQIPAPSQNLRAAFQERAARQRENSERTTPQPPEKLTGHAFTEAAAPKAAEPATPAPTQSLRAAYKERMAQQRAEQSREKSADDTAKPAQEKGWQKRGKDRAPRNRGGRDGSGGE
ncbi:relaxase/mobilization nuclease domain-containing protein [Caballeronia sp. AZ7_KS35]|uniref:relaxase/mobilization nuclease domain-containing protein n=1 Tax=Caballeronia sp. AZ7_KS35 TaxID=2921762 RepID=UPI0020291220|nr:relaxase/mobilization nuclease domain-containing protein [Caballeronia sp. AZ7_KS35]